MAKGYDRGGWPTEEPIDKSEHKIMDWHRRAEALGGILSRKGLSRVDQIRRAIEGIDPEKYESIGYYDRRVEALETLVVEKGILTTEEIDQKVAEMDQPWS